MNYKRMHNEMLWNLLPKGEYSIHDGIWVILAFKEEKHFTHECASCVSLL